MHWVHPRIIPATVNHTKETIEDFRLRFIFHFSTVSQEPVLRNCHSDTHYQHILTRVRSQ